MHAARPGRLPFQNALRAFALGTSALTLAIAATAPAHARVAYRFTDKITVAVNGTNLFDRHYYAAFGGTGNVFWGDPRRVLATLHLNY